MMVYRDIPLLFALPGYDFSRVAVSTTLVLLPLAYIAFLAGEAWPKFPYFAAMTLFMTCHGFIALLVSQGNILWIFRYALVFILIFGTSIVWALFHGEVKVAPFGVQFQSAENTRVLVHAGFLALCGSLLGWVCALRRSPDARNLPILLSLRARRLLGTGGLVLAVAFAASYVYKSGGLLLGGFIYSSDRVRDLGFEFGVFNIFHLIGVAMLLLSGLRPARIQKSVIFVGMVTLLLGVLTGSRADFLPQMFMLFMLAFNPFVHTALERRRYFSLVAWGLAFALLLYAGYVMASFVAIWRSGEGIARAGEVLFGTGANRLFISSVYGHPMLYFETGNMMLGGFYAAIVNVQEGITGLLWGESYFNYILTAPPAFLGLPRPLGLEWSASISGTRMAQGGIFEVAEAYWNFGFLGCLLVPFIISYIFGWCLRRGMLGNNYFFLTWYIVFGLHSFRSIWYQNFSYFRLFTIMLLIYLAARLFAHWFSTSRYVRHVESLGGNT